MSEDDQKQLWNTNINCKVSEVKIYKFEAEDLSGNKIMDIYNMTSQNTAGNTAKIPTRSSATTWTNLSANHDTGQDYLRLVFECTKKISGIQQERTSSTRSNSALCATLENITVKISPANTGCGYILALENVDPGFDIGWKDDSGIYNCNFDNNFNADIEPNKSELKVSEVIKLKDLDLRFNKQELKFKIKTDDGKISKKGSFTKNDKIIDLKDLKYGNYSIQILDGDKEYNHRFTKKHKYLNNKKN
jgi:hypothetical protein